MKIGTTGRPHFEFGEEQALRRVVADVGRAVAIAVDAETAQAGASTKLRSAWAELLQVLDLGPLPKLRECPCCHRSVRWQAVRCGYCWTALHAIAEPA